MNNFVLVAFWSSLLVLGSVSESDLDGNEPGEFIPTSEWQEVKPGQSIPSGLHVRMDLEKGGRWAKLMEEEKSEAKSLMSVDAPEDAKETGKNLKLDINELKSTLKKIKEDKVSDDTADLAKEVAKEKFRSMDEIKAAFDELQLQQESDFQVMRRLLERYRTGDATLEERVSILKDLETYVHQVDNALDFIKLNGMEVLVGELNNSADEIRLESAHVIGSATQSNPGVQIAAVEKGALSSLVRMVWNATEIEEVRRKALYAVSCAVRHFPSAQFMFRNNGGFAALENCLNQHGSEKLRFKAVSLLSDLAVERVELISNSQETEEDAEKRRQYQLFSLADEIRGSGFCEFVPGMLETEEHDRRETLVTAMENLHNVCQDDTSFGARVFAALVRYEAEYVDLAHDEEIDGDSDSYFRSMRDSVRRLKEIVGRNRFSDIHTEL